MVKRKHKWKRRSHSPALLTSSTRITALLYDAKVRSLLTRIAESDGGELVSLGAVRAR